MATRIVIAAIGLPAGVGCQENFQPDRARDTQEKRLVYRVELSEG